MPRTVVVARRGDEPIESVASRVKLEMHGVVFKVPSAVSWLVVRAV